MNMRSNYIAISAYCAALTATFFAQAAGSAGVPYRPIGGIYWNTVPEVTRQNTYAAESVVLLHGVKRGTLIANMNASAYYPLHGVGKLAKTHLTISWGRDASDRHPCAIQQDSAMRVWEWGSNNSVTCIAQIDQDGDYRLTFSISAYRMDGNPEATIKYSARYALLSMGGIAGGVKATDEVVAQDPALAGDPSKAGCAPGYLSCGPANAFSCYDPKNTCCCVNQSSGHFCKIPKFGANDCNSTCYNDHSCQ
jgi:hypothetical protein